MDLNELQRQLDKHMQEQNNAGRPDFDGYSPNEMHLILHHTIGPASPLQLRSMQEQDYQSIPIYNLTRYLAEYLHQHGELKLTAKGYLPTKMVAEIISQGYYTDYVVRRFNKKISKESDSGSVKITRLLLEVSGLAKKRYGKLSLTKNGEKRLREPAAFLEALLAGYTQKFNWAYQDGYGDHPVGSMGWGFSTILLAKYGDIERPEHFYADKYFRAFPRLLDHIHPRFWAQEEQGAACYVFRTFNRFMSYFGFIHSRTEGMFLGEKLFITKTAIVDKLFHIEAHKSR